MIETSLNCSIVDNVLDYGTDYILPDETKQNISYLENYNYMSTPIIQVRKVVASRVTDDFFD